MGPLWCGLEPFCNCCINQPFLEFMCIFLLFFATFWLVMLPWKWQRPCKKKLCNQKTRKARRHSGSCIYDTSLAKPWHIWVLPRLTPFTTLHTSVFFSMLLGPLQPFQMFLFVSVFPLVLFCSSLACFHQTLQRTLERTMYPRNQHTICNKTVGENIATDQFVYLPVESFFTRISPLQAPARVFAHQHEPASCDHGTVTELPEQNWHCVSNVNLQSILRFPCNCGSQAPGRPECNNCV